MHQYYIKSFNKYIVFVLFFFFLIFSTKVSGQILSNKANISILTCDAGSELYSIYGHTAIRIQDNNQNLDVVYNFGYFDFRTPNFYLKFVKGDLQYFAGTTTFEDFMAEYVYFQRGVYEQVLNLNQLQKQNIFNDLNKIINSDEKFYTYKFIDRNCTTMVVAILNKQLSTKINTNVKDSAKTDRTILYDCIKPLFYANFGINLMFGTKTDNKFDHIYLPLQFLEAISISKNSNEKLCTETKILNKQSYEKSGFSFWNSIYSFSIFFLLILVFQQKIVQYFYLFLMGFLGVFLFWVGFYSNHSELQPNINVLLFNPLYFVLLYFRIKNKIKYIKQSIYVIGFTLFIYIVLMINKVHLFMFSPIIITNSIVLIRLYLKTKKVQETSLAL